MRAANTIFAVALLIAGSAGTAGATTLTFDIPAGYYAPYTEGGFRFTNDGPLGHNNLGSWGPGAFTTADPSGTSATLYSNYSYTTTTLTRAGGGSFDLSSIDFANVYNHDFYGVDFDMTFNFAAGGSTTEHLSLLGIGLHTFGFALQPVSSVTWVVTASSEPWLQWDNVVVEPVGPSPTPIPATLPLFVSALGGLGLISWRRKYR
jgi:hypothetical protein